jgi:hypothetical protein
MEKAGWGRSFFARVLPALLEVLLGHIMRESWISLFHPPAEVWKLGGRGAS